MRGLITLTAVAVAIAAPAALLAPAAQAEVEVQHAPCGHNPPLLPGPSGTVIINSGISLRNGSSRNCPVSGIAQPGDRLGYYCYTVGDDGFTWTFVVDLTRGSRGWVRDVLLPGGGGSVSCGF